MVDNNYWLVVLTILKNIRVSWDDNIPNWMEK